MIDNVVSFQTREGIVGDGIKLDPDDILENNKGEFVSLALVGRRADGEICVAGTDSAAESLLLLQWGSQFIINNEVGRG